jgi:hypothetical protein
MKTLVLGGEAFQLPFWLLRQQCELFTAEPTLVASPYRVKWPAHLDVFRLFLDAVKGISVTITNQNISDLSQLCAEFRFTSLAEELSAFRGSPSFKEAEAAQARIRDIEKRIAALEQTVNLQMRKLKQTTQALNSALGRLSQLELIVNSQIPQALDAHSGVRALMTCRGVIDSLIVSDFPSLFDDFRPKKWTLLWRGSRDGFDTPHFHTRCDGHVNTLTLIQDVGGFVFGGFTPVPWESRVWNGKDGGEHNCWKGDDSLKSFLFTLANPHNIPARKFALKGEMKQYALFCASDRGPWFFGMGYLDSANPDANTRSYTDLDQAYTNGTGLVGKTVFTGSEHFRVKEIEVFEITD